MEQPAGPPSFDETPVSLTVADDPDPPQRARSHGRTALWLLGLGLFFGVAVPCLAVTFVLGQLDAPWLKARLEAWIAESTGFSVRYRGAAFSFPARLAVEELVVHTPEPFREVEPVILRVRGLRVNASLAGLGKEHGFLEALWGDALELAVVFDEAGRTSFDDSTAADTGAEARTPRSQLVREVLALLPMRRVHVPDVTLRFAEVQGAEVHERYELRGLALEAEVEPQKGLHVSLGQANAPLTLAFTRTPRASSEQHARLKLFASLNLGEQAADLNLSAHILDQNLAPDVPTGPFVEAFVHARFVPEEARTEVTFERCSWAKA